MKEKFFRFKKGSPAKKLGIEPIDLRKVGSSLAQSIVMKLDNVKIVTDTVK